MQQFIDFMKKQPDVTAHGYAVSPKRDDYRVTIEGLWVPEEFVTPAIKAAFVEFCKDADELESDGELNSWWD